MRMLWLILFDSQGMRFRLLTSLRGLDGGRL